LNWDVSMSDVHRTLAQLREERGLTIEALAAAIRVSPAKLVALEAGRYADLPNAAFTRALAMSVCRVLKADPSSILATLPMPDPVKVLTEVPPQQPFKSGHARLNLDTSFVVQARKILKPRFLLPLFILASATGVYFWPKHLNVTEKTLTSGSPAESQLIMPSASIQNDTVAKVADAMNPVESLPATTPIDMAPISQQAVSTPEVAPVIAPLVAPVVASAASTGEVGAQGSLVLQANDDAWVQIKDASGDLLLRRMVLAGERIALSGVLPLKVKVGNAAALSMSYQGQAVDLTEHTRANVARLELK
jgi:cytoskeleton protein RodZ